MDALKEKFIQALAELQLPMPKAAKVANVTESRLKEWKRRILRCHNFQPETVSLIEDAIGKIEAFNKLDKSSRDLQFPQLPIDRTQRKYLHKAAIHMSTEAWIKLESLRGSASQGEYLERVITGLPLPGF
ncbi:MAG: hypothetical protein EBY32_17370 [Proteobacteria bacterium]|nr:hypothetical protein [Pseudomonadota bacterium]